MALLAHPARPQFALFDLGLKGLRVQSFGTLCPYESGRTQQSNGWQGSGVEWNSPYRRKEAQKAKSSWSFACFAHLAGQLSVVDVAVFSVEFASFLSGKPGSGLP